MGVSVYRFEYELQNGNPWNVNIAAFTAMEAQEHLLKTLNKPIKITSSTMLCRLDDLSGELRMNVVNAFMKTQAGSAKKEKKIETSEQIEEKKIKK